MVRIRGAANSADESAKAIRPYAAIAAHQDVPPVLRRHGSTRELTKTNVIAWLDAQYDRETATIRLRLTAVKLFARWLRAEEGFNAEGTQICAVPDQIDGRPSSSGRELIAAHAGLTDLRELLMPRRCSGAEPPRG